MNNNLPSMSPGSSRPRTWNVFADHPVIGPRVNPDFKRKQSKKKKEGKDALRRLCANQFRRADW
jgi:hypothetical protein